MKRKSFYRLVIFLLFFSIFLFEGVNIVVASQAVKNLSETAIKGFTDGSATFGEGSTDASISQATDAFLENTGVVTSLSAGIGGIIGAGLSFLGIIFLLLTIYGGFLWMFASGNEQQIEKAKTLIQAAVTGLVIILAAYAVTSLLGSSFTNS